MVSFSGGSGSAVLVLGLQIVRNAEAQAGGFIHLAGGFPGLLEFVEAILKLNRLLRDQGDRLLYFLTGDGDDVLVAKTDTTFLPQVIQL